MMITMAGLIMGRCSVGINASPVVVKMSSDS